MEVSNKKRKLAERRQKLPRHTEATSDKDHSSAHARKKQKLDHSFESTDTISIYSDQKKTDTQRKFSKVKSIGKKTIISNKFVASDNESSSTDSSSSEEDLNPTSFSKHGTKMGGITETVQKHDNPKDASGSSSDASDSDSGDESGVTSDGEETVQAEIEADQANSDNETDDKQTDQDVEFAAIKKELANIPLEDLMKVKERLGLKLFNKIMHGDKFSNKKRKVFKRENKNRPVETSSKRRVPILRHNTVPKDKVRRDPRFDDLSGEFLEGHFNRNFSFLTDVKTKERELVEKKLKKTQDEDKKKDLTKLLSKMKQQEQSEQTTKKRTELEQKWKSKEKELVEEGKTPYFLKKSDKKKLELAEKFKELNKSGKIDQYLVKKRKKNAQKEKKKLPGRHQRFT